MSPLRSAPEDRTSHFKINEIHVKNAQKKMRRWKKLICNPNCTTPKYLESRGSWRNSQSLKHIWGFSKTKPENVRILACTEIPKIPDLGPLSYVCYYMRTTCERKYTSMYISDSIPSAKLTLFVTKVYFRWRTRQESYFRHLEIWMRQIVYEYFW